MWQTCACTVKHQISSAGTKSTSFYFIGIQLGRFLIWTPCPLLIDVNQPHPDVCIALERFWCQSYVEIPASKMLFFC